MLGASAAVGGSILAVGKSTADYAGDMYDMARGAGIGVEAFQKLAYAGRMSGVETEKLSASLVKFDRMVAEATGGNKTYMQTFEDLGIKIKDSAGNLRQPNEIFEDVADIFHNTEDGIGKTALAVELFGKSGADLIPMLNDGKAGLKAFYAEAERLGLALSNEMIAKGDAFSDQLENIGEQVKGVKLQLGAALIPALSAATEKISKVIDKITKWVQENPELAATIGNIAMTTGKWIAILGTAAFAIGSVTFIVGQFGKVFRIVSDSIKIGTKIVSEYKNGMLLFRMQYALFSVWSKIAAGQFGKVFRKVSDSIKIGTKIVSEYKNGMLLFRMQYALFSVWSKIAAAGQWVFNTSLYGCPVVWIVAGIMAIIAAVVLLVKYWDEVAAWFKKLWDAIVGIFKAAWEAIKKVWSTVTGWFSNLWGRIKAGAGKAWDGIKNTISKAREGVQKAWGSVKGWFSNLWGNVKSGISNAWGGIKDWFSNLQPVEWMRGAWENVGTFFENLGPRFYEWGKNLLQGLWNGITSMVDKIVEGMKNIGRRIANGFKSILGINSPSRLFAEYGLNITQGLVVGLDRGGAIVENATEGVAMQATRGITQSMQSSTVNTSTIVGGGNTGPSITYAPQITFAGSTTQEVRDEFGKMLKQHANEIMELIRKYEENKTRLSFA